MTTPTAHARHEHVATVAQDLVSLSLGDHTRSYCCVDGSVNADCILDWKVLSLYKAYSPFIRSACVWVRLPFVTI